MPGKAAKTASAVGLRSWLRLQMKKMLVLGKDFSAPGCACRQCNI